MKQLMINLAQRWIDRITRAPRGLTDGHGHAFSVDCPIVASATAEHRPSTTPAPSTSSSRTAVLMLSGSAVASSRIGSSNHDDHTVSAGTGRGSIVAIEFAPNPLED